MTNDTATTRLLFAILSQKCLKDINWPEVAEHPLLAREITNGHAARMRYARFKKQMEKLLRESRGDPNAGVRRARTPASPRRPKPPKKSPKKVKDEAKTKAKYEDEDEDGDSVRPGQQFRTADDTPKMGTPASLDLAYHPMSPPQILDFTQDGSPVIHSAAIKKELGMSPYVQYPMTPGSQHHSPNPDYHGSRDMETMMNSFRYATTPPPPGCMLPQWLDHSMGDSMEANGYVTIKREDELAWG